MNEAEHDSGAEPQFECVRLTVETSDGRVRQYEARYPILLFSRLIPSVHDFIVELAESAPAQQQSFLLRWAAVIRFWEHTRRHRQGLRFGTPPPGSRPQSPDEREAQTMRNLPRYVSDAESSPKWYESALELGLDAAEVPPDVYQAVLARRFTPGFDRFLNDFLEVTREATQEASNQMESELEQEYGPLEELTPQQLQQAERDLDQAERKCFEKHWNRYRTRANRADPSFKEKLPRYKKEAAEWVAAACDAAARTLWEQKLKRVLTEPAEERLFMSFYTRQELFAGRLLGFDDVLTGFFRWMEMVPELWLSCLVFEPDGPNAELFRDALAHRWLVYVIHLPGWRVQQRERDRIIKQQSRARKLGQQVVEGGNDVPPGDLPTDRKQYEKWLAGAGDDELDLVLFEIEAKRLGTRISEAARSTLSEEQQEIVEFLLADPDLDSSEIARRMGISMRKVQRLRAQIAADLEPDFPDL